ncbi:YodC family protein [Planctomycetota bacterium]
MPEFKEGIIVQLKSGGPKMTCTGKMSPLDEGDVSCQWFAGSKLESGWFPPNSLTFVKESESKKK